MTTETVSGIDPVLDIAKRGLRSSSPGTRLAAAALSARLGAPSARNVDDLGKTLELVSPGVGPCNTDECADGRNAAATALARAGEAGLKRLGLALGHDDVNIRRTAAHAIVSAGEAAVGVLPEIIIALSREEEDHVVSILARAITSFGHKAAPAADVLVDRLSKIGGDQFSVAPESLLEALAQTRSPGVLPFLRTWLAARTRNRYDIEIVCLETIVFINGTAADMDELFKAIQNQSTIKLRRLKLLLDRGFSRERIAAFLYPILGQDRDCSKELAEIGRLLTDIVKPMAVKELKMEDRGKWFTALRVIRVLGERAADLAADVAAKLGEAAPAHPAGGTSWHLHRAAIDALSEMGPAAFPHLELARLRQYDSVDEVFSAILGAMKKTGGVRALPALRLAITGRTNRYRADSQAANLIGELGPEALDAMPDLGLMLGSLYTSSIEPALNAIDALGAANAAVHVEALVLLLGYARDSDQGLFDTYVRIVCTACDILAEIGEPALVAIPALELLLDHKSKKIVKSARAALFQLRQQAPAATAE